MSDSKKRILFIVNPISGTRGKICLEDILPVSLDSKKFDWEIYYTTGRGDATRQAKVAVKSDYDIVAAVGGDGTINEVAQGLIGSDTRMTVVPNGSGNGFANYFNISHNPSEAISKLNDPEYCTIDTATFNGQVFLNVAGLGFDATIAHSFDKFGKRGFLSYARLTLREFLQFKASNYSIVVDGEKSDYTAFLITVANSTQFGNNAFIAPKAKIDDGLLDLVILKPFPVWNILSITYRLFNKSIHGSRHCITMRAKEISISTTDNLAQIDGEPIESKERNEIRICPASLKMMV